MHHSQTDLRDEVKYEILQTIIFLKYLGLTNIINL